MARYQATGEICFMDISFTHFVAHVAAYLHTEIELGDARIIPAVRGAYDVNRYQLHLWLDGAATKVPRTPAAWHFMMNKDPGGSETLKSLEAIMGLSFTVMAGKN
ncbi:hypothetical protein [Lacticaseibacillus daqingensis]|uniref:hypothetical protein n=1 Tax=Lacticaseibacillus daqingensis TaxID=2486014 RepID=UPI0013DE44C9|nr:hypothetical protein [Lacticaseibacillus daqingensis]